MRVAISQSNFLPWIGYFHIINSVDTFVVYDVVQYTKRDWRNRNRIQSAQGEQWITVPVKSKGNYLARIDEIEVDGDKWRTKICKTLETNYRRARYFDEISPALFEILEKKQTHLHELNLELMNWICAGLKITTKILSSPEGKYQSEDPSLRLLEICENLGAGTYVSGPAAKSYLEVARFTDRNISVEFFEYPKYPAYGQVFGPFLPNLSVVDLLFNLGWDETGQMII